MVILDGNRLSRKILEKIKREIAKRRLKLKLAVVLVGRSAVSKSYINKKKEACDFAGIEFQLFDFPSEISEVELKKEILKLAEDKSVSGIVVQLPLPKNFNAQEILNLIPEKKDIDVLSEKSFEKFSREKSRILPPIVCAVKEILEEYKINLGGKKIVLVGKGRLVGKPLAVWFEKLKLDFSIIDRSVPDIGVIAKEADVIISGAGVAGLIKKDMVKQGAVLIDAGASSEEGIVKGDIDKSCGKKAGFFAAVPGGAGPVAVACLLDNLLTICYDYNHKE